MKRAKRKPIVIMITPNFGWTVDYEVAQDIARQFGYEVVDDEGDSYDECV